MKTLAAIVVCAVALPLSALAQSKMTVEELLKPYDAKTRSDDVSPPAQPAARILRWTGFFGSACRCTGCGCKGGPGWRGPGGQCVSHASLTKECGSPPSSRCTYEGARQVCPSRR
jgi:hypothetical protein